ncbi:uncharacterized protein FFC1_06627 [Fusarium fujikuroi]|nr:uncharacterized protein FFC1_06627 [Fusarium fujikuroi]
MVLRLLIALNRSNKLLRRN